MVIVLGQILVTMSVVAVPGAVRKVLQETGVTLVRRPYYIYWSSYSYCIVYLVQNNVSGTVCNLFAVNRRYQRISPFLVFFTRSDEFFYVLQCNDDLEKSILYVACKPGFYGADCALKCGHCLGSKPCQHVDGSCPRGCKKGFTGDKCNACKIVCFFPILFALNVFWKVIPCLEIFTGRGVKFSNKDIFK